MCTCILRCETVKRARMGDSKKSMHKLTFAGRSAGSTHRHAVGKAGQGAGLHAPLPAARAPGDCAQVDSFRIDCSMCGRPSAATYASVAAPAAVAARRSHHGGGRAGCARQALWRSLCGAAAPQPHSCAACGHEWPVRDAHDGESAPTPST